MELKQITQKDQIIFFDKKSLNEPLDSNSKLIEHMANNDPNNPGNLIW